MVAVEPLPRVSIGRRTRADDVADHLLAAIDAGEFPIDSELPSEKDLAERFGVGRPSVRQALFHLQQQGLVQVSSGKRARVVRPAPHFLNEQVTTLVQRAAATPEGQASLEEVRMLFEPGIAMQAARRATDADVARLRERLEANVAASGSIPQFVRTDVEFHFELTVITGNPVFRSVHDVLRAWLVDQRVTTIHMPDATAFSVRDHEAIFEAVAARDPMRAFHAMTAHLRLINELYREARRISDSIYRGLVDDVSRRVEEEMRTLWLSAAAAAQAREP